MATSRHIPDSYIDIVERWTWRDVLQAHYVIEAMEKLEAINQPTK